MVLLENEDTDSPVELENTPEEVQNNQEALHKQAVPVHTLLE